VSSTRSHDISAPWHSQAGLPLRPQVQFCHLISPSVAEIAARRKAADPDATMIPRSRKSGLEFKIPAPVDNHQYQLVE
jgi:hypothetical protein